MLLKIKLDSIIYFNDSTTFKTEGNFKKQIKYLWIGIKDSSFELNKSYILEIALAYRYSIFKVLKVIKGDFIIINQKNICGYLAGYMPDVNHYYKKKKIKHWYYVHILKDEENYFKLPITKTHLVKKRKISKEFRCIGDI